MEKNQKKCKKWKLKKVIFELKQNKFLNVKYSEYFNPNAKKTDEPELYSLIRFSENNTGVILALNDKNEIILLKQYRPAANDCILGMPGGRFEKKSGKINQMITELRHETYSKEYNNFYSAKKSDFKQINTVFSNPARVIDKCTIFFVKKASLEKGSPFKKGSSSGKEETAEKGRIRFELNINRALDMIKSGKIKDTTTIATILLVKEKGLI